MAKKSEKAKGDQKQTTVRRVKAQDDKKVSKKPQVAKKSVVTNNDSVEPKKGAFKSFIGYFSGAWYELRQVRWPNRRATWSMTGALLMFTAIFVGFILLIDFVFENLFKLILGN